MTEHKRAPGAGSTGARTTDAASARLSVIVPQSEQAVNQETIDEAWCRALAALGDAERAKERGDYRAYLEHRRRYLRYQARWYGLVRGNR
jgi:hypothetical protein